MIKRSGMTFLLTALLPAGLLAQGLPVAQLEDALPEDIFVQVMEQVQHAQARALSGESVANLALEGVAKGRSGEDVLAAVEAHVADLGQAHDAIQAAGLAPEAGEVEAAAAAMSMGVDGSAVSDVARSGARGPELAAAILVVLGLTEQGFPAAEALSRVVAQLEANDGDASSMSELGPEGADMGQGGMPAELGLDLASGMAGFQVPVAGINVPMGPPSGTPGGRPGDLPGPGNLPVGPVGVPTPPGG